MSNDTKTTASAIRAYLSRIGQKGGAAGTGGAKRRGDAAYYRRIAQKAVKARRAKALTARG